jgi:membrane-bound lytic murein transglycosylase B
LFRTLSILLVFLPSLAFAGGYVSHPAYQAFEARMVKEHGFTAAELRRIFSGAERKDSILEAISRPAEKRLTWGEYRKIFLTSSRIAGGVEFARKNRAELARAQAEYGVPPEIIVAIIGVETRYGGNMGSYRVVDSLSTLAFDYPPRSKFFTAELEQFLLMTREQGFDPGELKGSYAGAMGMGQFIPSSFRRYAVDFDGDGKADIWSSTTDAIGSVAHYFQAHGWKNGGPTVQRAKPMGRIVDQRMNESLKPSISVAELHAVGLAPMAPLPAAELVAPMKFEAETGDEYWLGLHNFYVITRYNHSALYAMAVYQLSGEIAAGIGS